MPIDVGDVRRAELHGANLTQGGQYIVQVHATNQAGATSHAFSRPILVDETPPTCKLAAVQVRSPALSL